MNCESGIFQHKFVYNDSCKNQGDSKMTKIRRHRIAKRQALPPTLGKQKNDNVTRAIIYGRIF